MHVFFTVRDWTKACPTTKPVGNVRLLRVHTIYSVASIKIKKIKHKIKRAWNIPS